MKDGSRKVERSRVELFFKETLQHGFIISSEVIGNLNDSEIKAIIADVKDEIGLSPSQMNRSFHKSWEKIEKASLCQLVLEQMLHYISTYGFEKLGIYDKSSVYIPHEKLDIPSLEDDIPLTVIKGYTRAEMLAKLQMLLSSGIALKAETVIDVVNVAVYLGVDESFIATIKNKEAAAMLYDHLDKSPSDPVEFLRLAIYKSTNTTLLIKNATLIDAIKANDNLQLVKLFEKYDGTHGFKKLSAIFNRFKPIFLAFKTNDAMKHHVNQIAKLSKNHHVPMPEDYLNNVTAEIMIHHRVLDEAKLRAHLQAANIFRKARLANALNFRDSNPESIMYKVRNGKAYSTSFLAQNKDDIKPVLDIVIDSIIGDLKGVDGKKIYIPKNIVYALPATEKQFTGDIPSGSCVEVNNDMIVGVHWENVKEKRIDLDLSIIDCNGKLGWDSRYRSEDGSILYSGDMTDAGDEGAAEMFYIKKQDAGTYALSVNYYNHDEKTPVPFNVFIARERPYKLERNHMVNPNNIVCKAKTKIDVKQKMLGFIVITKEKTRFYFSEVQIGNSRAMSFGTEYAQHALKYYMTMYANPISLNDLLRKAGAFIITEKAERGLCDVDLSPENVTKETFLDLLRAP